MPVHKTRSGVHLFFDLSGPDDAPVVAFSNSLGTTIEMWDRQAEALAGRYRVLRYDTRGHGRSEVIDRETSVADLADDLAELLEGLHIPKAHIVGLSLGGMTAQVMGFRHPDKVESLVLMATSAAMPYLDLWNQRIASARGGRLAELADQAMIRWFTAENREREAAAVSALHERFLTLSPAGYAVCCAAIRDMDLRPDLPRITAPTLVISGVSDPATPPKDGEEIARLVRGAELVIVPDAAHKPNIEQTAIVNRHLTAWLDAHSGGVTRGAAGKSLAEGLGNRKSVLGVEHVERSLAQAGSFAGPWQDFITRYAWGEIWGDPALPRKTRSMLALTTCVALGKEEEFKLHIRPALRNGVSLAELRAVLMQSAVYAGVPAANGAFRWTREVLGAELDDPSGA